MPLPQLTTLCGVKAYMGISTEDTTQDTAIKNLIPQVSDLIRSLTGKDYGGTLEYTEYYSGDGTPVLSLRQRPAYLEGLQVWVDTQAAWDQGAQPFPDSSLLESTAYALELASPGVSLSGMLYRTGGVWPMCAVRLWQNQSPDLAADHVYPSGNVKVVYTAGTEPPAKIMLAANMGISFIMQGRQHGGMVSSESYSDYSYTLTAPQGGGYQSPLGPGAMAILATERELWF